MDDYGNISVSWAHGYAGHKIHHIDAEEICYTCGNNVKFINTTNKEEKVFQSPGNGISVLAASTAHKLFAVAEKCLDPKIFLCEYPSMEVKNILKGGALVEYKLMSFSQFGLHLVTYSGIPDFAISIWDCSTGNLLCRHEMNLDSHITCISFNPLNWQHICACGPDYVGVLQVEKCNQLYTMKERRITPPNVDGTIDVSDEMNSREESRSGLHINLLSSTKAGLVGEAAKGFKSSDQYKPSMKPICHCWSHKGEFYVGCEDGQLFSADSVSGRITILLSDPHGEIIPGMFNSLILNTKGLYAGGRDGILRMIHVEPNGLRITKEYEGTSEICCTSFNPDVYTELTCGTKSGEIWIYNSKHGKCRPLVKEHFGQFIGAAYSDGGNICVSCREDGTVQLWETEFGNLVSSVNTGSKTKATAFACCPSSAVVVVGTETGHICYVDISDPMKPRPVAQHRHHHSAVNYLMYNAHGTYLLSGSKEESQIIVINARPSSGFACIGYVDCMGSIKDITIAQHSSDRSHVAIVVIPHIARTGTEEEEMSADEMSLSDRLLIFSLPNDVTEKCDGNYASLKKDFQDEFIHRLTFDLTVPLDCAVITKVDSFIHVVALGEFSKNLMQFKFPFIQDDNTAIHNPSNESAGHELCGGSVNLSPHCQWLLSYSPDGTATMRDRDSMESAITIEAHSYLCDGVLMAAFSPDGQRIITIGKSDESLVSYAWELLGKGRIVMNSALEYARVLDMHLRSISEKEDAVLGGMNEWINPLGQNPGAAASKETTAEAPDESTWYDKQLAIAYNHENLQYDGIRKEIMKTIKDLRKTVGSQVLEIGKVLNLQVQADYSKMMPIRLEVMGMIDDNRIRPEIEQLDHEEYNLDVDEQKRLQQETEARIQKVRDEIEHESLAHQYLRYIIQKQCWDDMVLKGRAVKSFNAHIAVTNYPMMEQGSHEKQLVDEVARMRAIESEELSIRKKLVEVTKKPVVGDEEEDEEDTSLHSDVQLSLHGSLGPKHGGENEHFYPQFDLHARQQKLSQIILIREAMRKIRVVFNEAFSALYTNKEQEISRAKERNIRIREIMHELDMGASDIKDPEMDVDEKPEKVLTVSDEEVMVERVLSMEQEKQLEKEQKAEQARIEAAKSDNKRERGLVDMMGGVLEVKKEDVLKQDIPTPEFMTEKLEKDWTDEERKFAKEHEKRQKSLQEEREKYRKNLENELKKLQQVMAESTNAFDEQLLQLYNRKVKTDMVISQEELKIVRLSVAIMMDDEIGTQESHLNHLLELAGQQKLRVSKIENDIRASVDEYRELYDSVVAEDKMLDRAFKRDFSDIPLSLVDQMYKLFKRRPRIQRHHDQQLSSPSFNPYGHGGKLHVDDTSAIIEALGEMDNIINAPEGVEDAVWRRLCTSRKAKVESEQRVKNAALTLAEMSQYQQRRQEECEMTLREIDNIVKQQNKLCEERMRNNLNLEVQFLLKQGQVEVETGSFIPDYGDSVLIQRNVVEDLNGTIRGLGESKVAAMTECKDFRKGIHLLEWERKRMMMQMEDLHNKARHIQMLKLTKDLQLYLNEENHQARQARQMAVLEQTLAVQDKNLEKGTNQRNAIIQDLQKHIQLKEQENRVLEKETEELHVSVSERKRIDQVNETERAKNTADRRLKGIVQRRKLVDLAKAQAQEVAVLRAEVERLRMKTFPALVQVER